MLSCCSLAFQQASILISDSYSPFLSHQFQMFHTFVSPLSARMLPGEARKVFKLLPTFQQHGHACLPCRVSCHPKFIIFFSHREDCFPNNMSEVMSICFSVTVQWQHSNELHHPFFFFFSGMSKVMPWNFYRPFNNRRGDFIIKFQWLCCSGLQMLSAPFQQSKQFLERHSCYS